MTAWITVRLASPARRLALATTATLAGVALAACGTSAGTAGTSTSAPASSATPSRTPTAPTTTAPSTTTTPTTTGGTTGPATPVALGPLTSPPLPAPGPGFVPGKVTAVGDSVMLDYQTPLQQDIPGVDVEAAVSRQWGTGEQLLSQLKTSGQLGAVVVFALGTNGPIAAADVDDVMSILNGASRVVFVTEHVDQPWQDPNNAVLAAGVARYPNAVLADWNALASANPTWLYSDGTHLPIDGTGAQALAALIAGKV